MFKRLSTALALAAALVAGSVFVQPFVQSRLQAQTLGKGQTTVYLTGSAYTNATTSFTNVPGLVVQAAASDNFHANCFITWQGSAGTTGPKYQFTGPAAPTAVILTGFSWITNATFQAQAVVTAFSTPYANTGTITTATNFTDHLELAVLNGANAGAVQLQAAANGAGTLTIQPGSYCIVV